MSRSAEFGVGATQPGRQPDYWANMRYGDKEQLPAPTTRRAGPLGPDTAEEAAWKDREVEWAKWH